MHADFFRDLFDHHRLQLVGTVIEKVLLAAQNRLADAQNRVLALLDVLHQLNGSGKALFDVVSDVAIGGIAGEQAPISGTEAQLRDIVIVHEDLPLAVLFAELDVRLHKSRLSFVVAQAGLWIEALNHVNGALDQLHRAVERARNLLQLIVLQELEMIGDDLPRESVLRVQKFDLHEKAFWQITRADSRRVKFLHQRESLFNVVYRIISGLPDLLKSRREVPVFIKVADDRFSDLPHRLRADTYAQLPIEVICQISRG